MNIDVPIGEARGRRRHGAPEAGKQMFPPPGNADPVGESSESPAYPQAVSSPAPPTNDSPHVENDLK